MRRLLPTAEAVRHWWPIPLLWAMVLAFFWPLISPFPWGQMFVVEGDFTHQFYPFHHFAASEWWEGRIPLWNPYILGGHPFQADPQSAVFYPLNLLICFFGGFGGLSPQALHWQVVLDYLLGATFSFLFIRKLTGHVAAAAIGAVVFTFSGYLTSYPMRQMAILETAVWLPLILLFLERAAAPERRLANWGLAGLALGIGILAGHPQTAMYLVYAALAYYVYRAVSARLPWRTVALGVVAVLLPGLGVAAVQILPTLELASLSTRSGSLSYEMAGSGYGPGSLPGLLLPDWHGEAALYVGAVSLVLIVIAWLKPRGQVVFWSAAALVAVLMSLGRHGFLFPVLYAAVPGFRLFQDQERVMLVFALAIAVLTAYGCQNLFEARARLRRRWRSVALVGLPVVVVAGGAVLAWQNAAGFSIGAPIWTDWFRLAGITLATVAVAVVWLFGRCSGVITKALLAALVVADLFMVNCGSNLSSTDPMPPADLIAAMGSLRSLPEPYRIAADDSIVWPMNYGSLAQAPNLVGDTPIALRRTHSLLATEDWWRLWQIFNVKFYVTQKAVGDEFTLVQQLRDSGLYSLNYSMPRIWVVNDVRVAADEAEALSMTLNPGNELGQMVVLEQKPTPTFTVESEHPGNDYTPPMEY